MAGAYADVPYPGFPYARTHPDHLALLARVHGLSPADPDDCHVVELACGDGLNLIPMAAAGAGVRVTGIDREPSGIDRGRELARRLGIGDRVGLETADLLDFPDLGEADFVICHGLYTWAPAAVADAALAVMARTLAPDGVGFLSFNLMPGWRVRRALGPALGRRGGIEAARELLGALADPLGEREDAYGQLLEAERARLSGTSDGLLFHDDLGAGTRAAWHADVVAHADHHGLHVLRDAHPATLEASPVADQELADLVFGTPYREVALVHATAGGSAQPDLGRAPEPVERFTRTPGERPFAYPLARLQAERGERDVTTLRHMRLTIPDDAGRAILAACDGARGHAAIAASAGVADEVIPVAVERLAENALMVR